MFSNSCYIEPLLQKRKTIRSVIFELNLLLTPTTFHVLPGKYIGTDEWSGIFWTRNGPKLIIIFHILKEFLISSDGEKWSYKYISSLIKGNNIQLFLNDYITTDDPLSLIGCIYVEVLLVFGKAKAQKWL